MAHKTAVEDAIALKFHKKLGKQHLWLHDHQMTDDVIRGKFLGKCKRKRNSQNYSTKTSSTKRYVSGLSVRRDQLEKEVFMIQSSTKKTNWVFQK